MNLIDSMFEHLTDYGPMRVSELLSQFPNATRDEAYVAIGRYQGAWFTREIEKLDRARAIAMTDAMTDAMTASMSDP